MLPLARRLLVVGATIAAAVLRPRPDPFTQVVAKPAVLAWAALACL